MNLVLTRAQNVQVINLLVQLANLATFSTLIKLARKLAGLPTRHL